MTPATHYISAGIAIPGGKTAIFIGVLDMMKPVAKEAKMNKAEAHEPKAGHSAPGGKHSGKSNDAGAEGSANMAGAFHGGSAELHAQHPHAHDDHGPHHNDMSHVRHKPYSMK